MNRNRDNEKIGRLIAIFLGSLILLLLAIFGLPEREKPDLRPRIREAVQWYLYPDPVLEFIERMDRK